MIKYYNLPQKTASLFFLLFFLCLADCRVSSVNVKEESKGNSARISLKEASAKKGTIRFEKFIHADWEVDRGGLIYLKDPVSVSKGIKEGKEPIQIYMYSLTHPVYGTFLIDTGMSDDFKKPQNEWPVSSIIRNLMNADALKVRNTTGEWIRNSKTEVKGVFMTHLHMDHIMGAKDIPASVPFYTGPKEVQSRAFQNLFVQSATDRLIGEGKTVTELQFAGTEETLGMPALDFFGDGSFIILYSPGHTPGSLAFIVNSTSGQHLLLGDSCHTVFGWENSVPPGDFTADRDSNRKSLGSLKKIASLFPKIKVHPGHQSIKE
ncbi:MAG TPA: MBL fold metallo-hydrolase [Leptospiraceae bacterium]|nr:MBL fold metallo-hydrolase [Leptospiraceae bacterium]